MLRHQWVHRFLTEAQVPKWEKDLLIRLGLHANERGRVYLSDADLVEIQDELIPKGEEVRDALRQVKQRGWVDGIERVPGGTIALLSAPQNKKPT